MNAADPTEADGAAHHGEIPASTPPLNRKLLERYPYVANIPVRGLMVEGRPALTGIAPDLVGEYVLMTVRDPLCGYDDDPAEIIARRLERPHLAGRNGMFTTWSGWYRGAHISIVSGGSGGPEAELALHELIEYTDATTYLRVGGAGGMHPDIEPGDVVIASGVVRDEGTTAAYVPPQYPAVCDPDVVVAMAAAAQHSGARYHVGTVRSADSDYVGGGRPGARGFIQPWHLELVDQWTRVGVLCGEREAAAIVTLARLHGLRGGAVISVADNLSTGAVFAAGAGHEAAIEIALDGCARLQRMDRDRREQGSQIYLPPDVMTPLDAATVRDA